MHLENFYEFVVDFCKVIKGYTLGISKIKTEKIPINMQSCLEDILFIPENKSKA